MGNSGCCKKRESKAYKPPEYEEMETDTLAIPVDGLAPVVFAPEKVLYTGNIDDIDLEEVYRIK
jgi:hypothetical protein